MTDSPTSKVMLSLEHGWLCWRDDDEHLMYSLKLEQLQERGGQIELPEKLVPAFGGDAHEPPGAQREREDMESIGRNLLATIKRNLPDYSWLGCPSEVIVDLMNKLDDGEAAEPRVECPHAETVDLEDAHARWCTECGAFHDNTQWIYPRRLAPPPAAALPISSAPRTGKRILLWAAIVGTPGKWVTGRYSCDAYRTINDIVIGAEEGFQCDGDECIPSNQEVFTHWRPLPGEPETKNDELRNVREASLCPGANPGVAPPSDPAWYERLEFAPPADPAPDETRAARDCPHDVRWIEECPECNPPSEEASHG